MNVLRSWNGWATVAMLYCFPCGRSQTALQEVDQLLGLMAQQVAAATRVLVAPTVTQVGVVCIPSEAAFCVLGLVNMWAWSWLAPCVLARVARAGRLVCLGSSQRR